jgi:hypothetical protein
MWAPGAAKAMRDSRRETAANGEPSDDANDTTVGIAELPSCCRLASDEAELNRRELSKLYSEAGEVIGEVRYTLLWRLSEISRICTALERVAEPDDLNDPEEVDRLRERTAQLALEAVQLRQEARLLLNSYQKASIKSAEASTVRRLRPVRFSGRYSAAYSAF